ncbi:hypothetical protein S2L_05 [Cyanophage S-2L]|nr:hypothetical protein S2L_05 [Cyanophage S-2L]
MRPLYAFLSTFCGGLVVFAATTAQASPLEPSTGVFRLYAQLGALEYGVRSRARGDGQGACTAYRHLLFLEMVNPDSTPKDISDTQRLISLACR